MFGRRVTFDDVCGVNGAVRHRRALVSRRRQSYDSLTTVLWQSSGVATGGLGRSNEPGTRPIKGPQRQGKILFFSGKKCV